MSQWHLVYVSVGGTDRTEHLLTGSLEVTYAISSRGVARFTLDYPGSTSYRPQLDDAVLVTSEAVFIFGGMVMSITEKMCDPDGLSFEIEAADYNAYADRRYICRAWPKNTTVKTVVQACVDECLDDYGVTLDAGQGGDTIYLEAMVAYYVQVTEVLNNVAKLAGNWIWNISPTKVLKVFDPTGNTAPFSITDANPNSYGDITVSPSRDHYANRVILRYGDASSDITDAFVCTGSERHWHPTKIPLSAPGSVIINKGLEDERTESVGVWGVDDCEFTYKDTDYTINQSELFDILIEGTTIEFSYQYDASTEVIVNNVGEQTLHGIWETVVESSTAQNAASATAEAEAILAQVVVVPREVIVCTREKGLEVGQLLTINIADRNLNGTFLIVETSMTDAGWYIEWKITCVEGDVFPGSWKDLYKEWSGGGGSSMSSVSGGSGYSVNTGTVYPLGGSDNVARQSATPTWVDASYLGVQLNNNLLGGKTVTVFAHLRRSSSAAVSVKARLYDITNSLQVGISESVTSDSWTTVSFLITPTAGLNWYRLQLLPGAANEDVFGMGYLEIR